FGAMKLTPLDLQQKTFRKGRLGGLDEKEVRAYLDFVATELEEMTRKLNRQDEELRRREARINEFKDREQLLQQTLTTAQRLAEEMKANGRKEADIVLRDAEARRARSLFFKKNLSPRSPRLRGVLEDLSRPPLAGSSFASRRCNSRRWTGRSRGSGWARS